MKWRAFIRHSDQRNDRTRAPAVVPDRPVGVTAHNMDAAQNHASRVLARFGRVADQVLVLNRLSLKNGSPFYNHISAVTQVERTRPVSRDKDRVIDRGFPAPGFELMSDSSIAEDRVADGDFRAIAQVDVMSQPVPAVVVELGTFDYHFTAGSEQTVLRGVAHDLTQREACAMLIADTGAIRIVGCRQDCSANF